MELMIPNKGLYGDPLPMLIDPLVYNSIKDYKWFINNRGYAAASFNGKYWLLHRLILDLKHGDKRCVDHLNRNKLDNRLVNLRICTREENLKNKSYYIGSKSKFKGVDHRHGSRFRARIRVNKKIILLGTYSTEEEAAMAYDKAALIYVGPFAYLNFPNEAA